MIESKQTSGGILASFAKAAAMAVSLALCGSAAAADSIGDLPDRPLRIAVGTAAGGIPDVLSRIVAEQVTAATGRTIVVENKVGAAGLLAINYVEGLPADGTSMVLAETGSYGIAPHLTHINPFADAMVPVSLLGTAPIFLVVNSDLGVSSMPELIAYLKAHPGTAYGSSGTGSSHHLAMELLKSKIGATMTHVPYRGAAQTALAVTSGEVKLAFLGMNTAVPQTKSGKIKILGVASQTPSALLPDVPPIAQAVPGYDINVTLGLFVPAATPKATVQALNAALNKAALSPGVKDKLASAGIEAIHAGETPASYSSIIKREYQEYGDIVRLANVSIQ